ncbi:MAG: B12-binding domain-containing radical SAM protein [Alphaproteobacteria bacterium]|nr:B12-binding domain-containing radical SAM protein [Alphaproteobacteria bacterium]
MKVALVSPYPDITNYGLRTLSAVLRAAGHETRFICMPDFAGDGEMVHVEMSEQRYPPAVIEQFKELTADADLVGVTLMTHYFDTARQLTQAVKDAHGTPVIWGGFHPSVRPDECAKWADYVAIGDAEDLVLKLCAALEDGKERELHHIKGLVWRDGGDVVRNPPGSLEQELDDYPHPDFSLDDHWILFEGQLMPVTKDLLRRYLHNGTVSRMFGKIGYQTMTGRGCPHACTYCGNSFYRDLYKRQRYVRYRSVEDVIVELENVKRAYPFINFIWFSDDSFFGRPLPDMLEFAEQYKRRVGDPFYLLGSPGTITEEKYAALVDAGLHCIQMGIEHGSPRIQKMMKRSTMGNDKILRSAEIIAKYADRTAPPQYDIIYDLPYETLEDKLDTLRLIAQLPKPYRLQAFSVIFYPGTSLHTLAMKDGLVHDEKAEIYDKMYFEKNDTYTNVLLYLAKSGRMPHSVLRALIDERVVHAATSDYARPFAALAKTGIGRVRRMLRNPALERARALGTFEARMTGMTGANAGAVAPWEGANAK